MFTKRVVENGSIPSFQDSGTFLYPTGPAQASWLPSSLTQNQLPFSVTLEILDVEMEDGRRS